jgi:hypothetical protein
MHPVKVTRGRMLISHTNDPNDLLHPSPAPDFRTLQVYEYVIYVPSFPCFSSYFVINLDWASSVGTMTS